MDWRIGGLEGLREAKVEQFWLIWGLFLRHSGSICCHLGSFEGIWGHLGVTWGHFGALWVYSGPFGAHLGPILVSFGIILGSFCPHFEQTSANFGVVSDMGLAFGGYGAIYRYRCATIPPYHHATTPPCHRKHKTYKWTEYTNPIGTNGINSFF